DVPLEDVIKAICEKHGWGYVVISGAKNAYDGQLRIKVGNERGYPEGKGPPKDRPVAKDKGEPKEKADPKDATEPKDRPPGKDRPRDKGKTEPKDKGEPKEKAEPKDRPEDDEERAERTAATKLKAAKGLIDDGKPARAKEICLEIIKKYPKTKAAEEA